MRTDDPGLSGETWLANVCKSMPGGDVRVVGENPDDSIWLVGAGPGVGACSLERGDASIRCISKLWPSCQPWSGTGVGPPSSSASGPSLGHCNLVGRGRYLFILNPPDCSPRKQSRPVLEHYYRLAACHKHGSFVAWLALPQMGLTSSPNNDQ